MNDRFIPAGAGNTFLLSHESGSNTVYPRWRGEHAAICPFNFSWRGLSPLARGTRQARVFVHVFLRFIPAGAGNTALAALAVRYKTVYPRWRGEHGQRYQQTRIPGGLSPLARGTRVVNNLIGKTRRFIPAGAGNTLIVYHCL